MLASWIIILQRLAHINFIFRSDTTKACCVTKFSWRFDQSWNVSPTQTVSVRWTTKKFNCWWTNSTEHCRRMKSKATRRAIVALGQIVSHIISLASLVVGFEPCYWPVYMLLLVWQTTVVFFQIWQIHMIFVLCLIWSGDANHSKWISSTCTCKLAWFFYV